MTTNAPPVADVLVQYEFELAAALLKAILPDDRDSERIRGEKDAAAWRAVDLVQPPMIADHRARVVFEIIADRFVAGRRADLTEILEEVQRRDDLELTETYLLIVEAAVVWQQLESRVDAILREHRKRSFRTLLEESAKGLMNGAGKDGGKRLADRLAMKLMELYATGPGETGRYLSAEDVIEKLRARALNEKPRGVPFPWPKLEKHCGPLVPGQDVLGITGYSGSGKSALVANLFVRWIRRGIPCIGFPTEMGLQWVERATAAEANVSQWRAEKGIWGGVDGRQEQEAYLETLEDLRTRGDLWVIVDRPSMKPVEIATAVRVLRKRWDGEPVLFFVDHMHRLDYGSEKADEQVGHATKMLHNLAMEDGALIPVLLYQPKKPEQGNVYGPIAGHRIRGHSEVWNELTIHLSPYRMVVETRNDRQTAWGTPSCKMLPNGAPKTAKPDPERSDRKVDDEHAYVKVDKRRIGGEGPTVVLEFWGPSGKVWELEDSQTEAV